MKVMDPKCASVETVGRLCASGFSRTCKVFALVAGKVQTIAGLPVGSPVRVLNTSTLSAVIFSSKITATVSIYCKIPLAGGSCFFTGA